MHVISVISNERSDEARASCVIQGKSVARQLYCLWLLEIKENISIGSNDRKKADRPDGGLAAANTEVRDFSIVVIPALATDIVCCSIAWWFMQVKQLNLISIACWFL